MCLHQDVGLRDEDDLDHAALDLLIEPPPEAARVAAPPLLGLLEGEENALLAGQGPAVEELEQKDRLAGPGDARNEKARAARDALPEEVVELVDARLQARLIDANVLALDRDARRVDLDAALTDDERVLVATVLRTAHLHNLDEALLLARLLTLGEHDQSVDDGEADSTRYPSGRTRR